jgi:hypothetical protein
MDRHLSTMPWSSWSSASNPEGKDATSTEKLADGTRNFAADIVKLEQIIEGGL